MSDAVDFSDVADGAEFTDEKVPRSSRMQGSAPRVTQSRGRRVSDKRLSALSEKLSGEMFQAGTMIGFGLPVTGYYIAQESSEFTSALVNLASRRTEWVEALESLAAIGPGIAVGRTVVGIGAALGADRYHRTEGVKGISPDKMVMGLLKVSQAYYAVHPDEMDGAANATGEGNWAAPPVFQPIA